MPNIIKNALARSPSVTHVFHVALSVRMLLFCLHIKYFYCLLFFFVAIRYARLRVSWWMVVWCDLYVSDVCLSRVPVLCIYSTVKKLLIRTCNFVTLKSVELVFVVEISPIMRSRSTLLFTKKFNLYFTITTINKFHQIRLPVVVIAMYLHNSPFIIIFLIQHHHIQCMLLAKYSLDNYYDYNMIGIQRTVRIVYFFIRWMVYQRIIFTTVESKYIT